MWLQLLWIELLPPCQQLDSLLADYREQPPTDESPASFAFDLSSVGSCQTFNIASQKAEARLYALLNSFFHFAQVWCFTLLSFIYLDEWTVIKASRIVSGNGSLSACKFLETKWNQMKWNESQANASSGNAGKCFWLSLECDVSRNHEAFMMFEYSDFHTIFGKDMSWS